MFRKLQLRLEPSLAMPNRLDRVSYFRYSMYHVYEFALCYFLSAESGLWKELESR